MVFLRGAGRRAGAAAFGSRRARCAEEARDREDGRGGAWQDRGASRRGCPRQLRVHRGPGASSASQDVSGVIVTKGALSGRRISTTCQ